MLGLNNISKIFPGVVALDDVSIQFHTGEIHALIGENGAGKSTLIKIICGIYKADLGYMDIDGEKLSFKGFQDAIDHSINFVSQEIQIIPNGTVAENICIDRINKFSKWGIVNWKAINATAKRYLEIVGMDIDPKVKIKGLTAAQKQLIQIAKAISSGAKYLLLDEPTSSLTKHEAENLFQLLRQLKQQNVGIIFVSHKIEEITELCDTITVLRDGKIVGTMDCESVTRDEIVHMMIGRDQTVAYRGFLDIKDEKVLEVRHLSKYGLFDDINVHLNRGEILGWYGLIGSGRTELARLIIGERPIDDGEILINGKQVRIKSISDSLYQYGIGYVTENRKEEGLILNASIEDNISITIWNKITNKFQKINRKKEIEAVDDIIDALKIKCPSRDVKTLSLSGGNQQKVSIGKWLAATCEIFIFDEPTVGVDIGAKEYIHSLIWDLAKVQGKSVILISSDLPELVSLARRVLVFADKKIKGEITGLNETEKTYEEVSREIGNCML